MLHLYSFQAWPLLGVVALLALAVVRRARLRKARVLPPGPWPLPLVGNIVDFPQGHLGSDLARLSAKYGLFFLSSAAYITLDLLTRTSRGCHVHEHVRAADHRPRIVPSRVRLVRQTIVQLL